MPQAQGVLAITVLPSHGLPFENQSQNTHVLSQQHGFQNKKLRSSAINAKRAVVRLLSGPASPPPHLNPEMTKDGKKLRSQK